MCSWEGEVGGCCMLPAALAYAMGWWWWNECGSDGNTKGILTPEWLKSCIVNLHLVVPPSVSNLTGISRSTHLELSLCHCPQNVFFTAITYYHLCKALHLFSIPDKWPPLSKTTGHTCYSAVTMSAQCSVLFGRCHSDTFSNVKSFLIHVIEDTIWVQDLLNSPPLHRPTSQEWTLGSCSVPGSVPPWALPLFPSGHRRSVLLVLPAFLSRNPPPLENATEWGSMDVEKHAHQMRWTQSRLGNNTNDKLQVEEKENDGDRHWASSHLCFRS